MSIRIINSGSIDGRPIITVMGFEFLMQISERNRHENVHAPQQVALGDAIFQPELVEQTTLMPSLPPHHRPVPVADDQSATGITVRRPSQALFRHHRPNSDIKPVLGKPRDISVKQR
jgi:hypothetical protein